MSIDCFSYDFCYLRFFTYRVLHEVCLKIVFCVHIRTKYLHIHPSPFSTILFVTCQMCELLEKLVCKFRALLAHEFETGSAALNQFLQRPPPPPPPTASAVSSAESSNAAVPASARPPNSPADSTAHPNNAAGVAIATIARLAPEHELLTSATTTPDPCAKRHGTRKFTLLLRSCGRSFNT